MRTTLFMLMLTPLLGGCLGPAPWADWDSSQTVSSNKGVSPAPWNDRDTSADGSVAISAVTAPAAKSATYGPRPAVQTLAAEPITAPPPTRAQPIAPTESMGGPYVPLDGDAGVSEASPTQPLKLRGSGTVRTLPLVMSGTGERIP